ncbi:MAG: cell wall hydrolase [Alphaproteobacteria bacterium]|nr:cell wall hydrolase [Alphaproteobacteria bacterium]
MQLTLIKNTEPARGAQYKIARVVYAETRAASLGDVEAMCAMIANRANAIGCNPADVVTDADVFGVLEPGAENHALLNATPNTRGFDMCLRVVQKMMNGNLPDVCHGATRFHHSDVLPAWAVARGYIHETDNLLFYL